jgi:hypothetical protein
MTWIILWNAAHPATHPCDARVPMTDETFTILFFAAAVAAIGTALAVLLVHYL